MIEEQFCSETVQLRPHLVALANRYLRDADEAEDVVQDVSLRLFQMMDQLAAPLRPLAFVLVRNACVDRLRHRRVHEPLMSLSSLPEETSVNEAADRVVELVEDLPIMQQTVVRLRHFEGLDTHAIARMLGMTEAAVRKNLSRARISLRQRYAE